MAHMSWYMSRIFHDPIIVIDNDDNDHDNDQIYISLILTIIYIIFSYYINNISEYHLKYDR